MYSMYLSMLYSVQLSDQSNPVLLVHPPMRLATVILRHLSFCSVAYVSTHLHPTIALQTYKLRELWAVHVYKWSSPTQRKLTGCLDTR